MFQHVCPEQPAGGLHTRVVWAEARQLPLLRVKLIYPHFLLWKLVSFKNVLCQNRKLTPRAEGRCKSAKKSWWLVYLKCLHDLLIVSCENHPLR